MRKLCVLVGLVLLAATLPAAANLVTNGSFEDGVTIPGEFLALTAGDSTSITDWTVTAGTIDYIRSYWVAAEGSRSLDLSGSSAGTVAQTSIPTVPGQWYRVTFALAGNPVLGPTLKTVGVGLSAGPTSTTFTFDITGHSQANMGWVDMSWDFEATSTATDLQFSSLDSPATFCGPALDNVRVEAIGVGGNPVPEPLTMIGAFMGLSSLGMYLRRRTKATVA